MSGTDSERWADLQALFEAAVEARPEDRESVLVRADPELRAEVRALLAAEAEADQRLRSLVSEAAVDASTKGRLGQRVGPYRIEGELGHGGMGSVFLARRADGAFEGKVAIKLIRGLHTAEHLRRFEIERRILARLDHPHIARLLDAGTTEDGAPYVVMEYVDGVPITDFAAKLDLRAQVELVVAVGHAVAHAHRSLVVHRDLKPANVLVRADGQPRLLDFGIARLLDDEDGTRSDLRALTPQYASPEQVRGQPITVAADVYGLGMVAYRLLAGRLPFEREAETAPHSRTSLDPPPPSRRTPETDRSRRLHGDLDAILLQALRPRPEERYLSVGAFVEDLERWLAGLPVRARSPSFPERIGRAVRRRPWAFATAAAVVAGTAIFVVQLNLQAEETRRQRDAALRAQARAEAVTGFLVDLFEVADPWTSGRADLSAREILARGSEQIDGAFEDDPALRASMLQVLGRVHRNLGDYARSEKLLEEALAVHQAMNAPTEELASSHFELGETLGIQRELDAARSHLERAVSLFEAASGGAPSPGLADALEGLGTVASDQGLHEEAERHFRAALAIERRLHPEPHPDVASRMLSLGHALRRQERVDDARSYLEDALEMRRTLLGPDHPDVGHALNHLARLELMANDPKRAEALARQGLDVRLRSLGPKHLEVATSWAMLAAILKQKGEHAEARDALHQSLTGLRASFDEDHPLVARVKRRIAALDASQPEQKAPTSRHAGAQP